MFACEYDFGGLRIYFLKSQDKNQIDWYTYHRKGGTTMIYYTGDIHGQKHDIERFCKRFNPTREDIIVILGDVGANYGQDERDEELKNALDK